MKRLTSFFVLFILGITTMLQAQQPAYLFAYFTGDSGDKEAVRYAVSLDGFNYRALNNNEPVICSKKISITGGVRDPFVLRGEDGKSPYP